MHNLKSLVVQVVDLEGNQPAVDSGSVVNVANITASSLGQTNNVSGVSDDPDTVAQDDPTVSRLSQLLEAPPTLAGFQMAPLL